MNKKRDIDEDQVIKFFKTQKDNSIKAMVKEFNSTPSIISRVIDNYLKKIKPYQK